MSRNAEKAFSKACAKADRSTSSKGPIKKEPSQPESTEAPDAIKRILEVTQ